MKTLHPLALVLLSASSAFATGSLFARSPPGYGQSNGYSPTSTGTGGTGNSGSAGNETSAGVQGDSSCSSAMCVAAQVNGDTVRYTLTGQQSQVGWMAMGFGRQMARTPMVIMWANADGSLTLSQRQASSQSEPAVVAAPPREASVQPALSVTSGSNQQYVFDIPANSDTRQDIIWAFSPVRPSSAAADATLRQHTNEGRMTLDLTKTTGGTPGGDDGTDNSETVPLTNNEKTLLAHAVIATVGFLLVLPVGGLIPRYLRTFSSVWFKLHWIIQFILGGLTVVIGVILGIVGVANSGGSHVNSTHKSLGIALLVLYVVQASLGAIIHFFKPNSPRRPPQNYVHAILGLLIVALALYQVRTGYKNEWPGSVGREATRGVNIVWHVWVVLLPVAYAAGLALLPRQFKQEKKAGKGSN